VAIRKPLSRDLLIIIIIRYWENRRNFLLKSFLIGAAALTGKHAFGALEHRYKLAPEALLPKDVRDASAEVREAYRLAIANRDTLRYIPCYCGCGEQGRTSNASCYFKDNSPEKTGVRSNEPGLRDLHRHHA
jgi:Protein of unknown function with PCYCGC motif